MGEEKLSEKITDDVKGYVNMRVDNVKLGMVEGLAGFAGKAVAFVICLFLVTLALMLFTGVFVYLINLLVDSWVWSAVILGGIYLLIGILFFLKPGFFQNKMVRVFAQMFFCPKKEHEDE